MSLTTASIDAAHREELALADERVEMNWNQLDPLVNRAANAMARLNYGIRRIGVFAFNSAEAVIAYLACLEVGVSSVPINFHLTPGEAAYILRDSQSSAVFVGPETLEAGLAAAREAGIATIIGWRCPPSEQVTPWEDWLARSVDTNPPTDFKPLPHLHYTSGTTGRPKATETPPQYFPPSATVADLAAAMREGRTPTPALAVGPLYHTGPLRSVRNLFGGGSLVTMASFNAETVLATIERYRIAFCVFVPTHFQRLLALPAEIRAKYDLSSLQRVSHTGAACPRDVKRAMIEWFGPILWDVYGGTEAGSTNSISTAEWLERPGSVGKAMPPFETFIIGDDGRVCGPNEEGQVYFRDATGRGIIYHGDPEKTAAAHIAPGVFTLGEVGYVDSDGYLFITDRVSDMIVSGGVNIYPAEAEQVLVRHPQVADVAVLAAPNAEMGEEVKALIVPVDPSRPPTAEELNRFVRNSLAGYKCPRSYDIVSDIGRNAMGKINKRALRQRYWPTGRTIGG